MPFLGFGHPSFEALSEFTDATTSRSQRRVASHLAKCSSCRAAVQAFRAARSTFRESPIDPLPALLRARVLESRTNGARIILPTGGVAPRPARRLLLAAGAAAVVVVAVLAEGIVSSTHQADAGGTSGTMTLSPAMPRPGQSVRVSYKAPASLSQFGTLALRARLRSVNDRSYEGGVPVRTIATLARGGSGGIYTASFVLPDSIVFAALAVEDSAGAGIDDHEKRTWEVLTTLDGQRPSLAALDQRANDMMGRSFEEGHATTRRMVELYPDSVDGWSYLHAFESWMGIGDRDSILATHRAALAGFERRWRTAPVVPPGTLGRLAWYSGGVDTASRSFWRARLMREAPTDGFALQWRIGDRMAAMRADHDTSATFRVLDTLWEQRSTDRALQIAGVGLSLAVATRRPDVIDRWWSRMQSVTRDPVSSEITFADQLSRVPSLATLGVERLRRLLARLEEPAIVDRHLSETIAERASRSATRRRRVLASLGRALVASGSSRAGLDTLMIADRTGWDLGLIRAIRSAAFSASDSSTGWTMTARLVADLSTSDAARDSLDAAARARLGDARWAVLRQEGSRLFSHRMLEDSRMQSLAATARLRDDQGRVQPLRDLSVGRVTVVAFWSRFCGWALDDVGNLVDVAQRLDKVGSRLLLVVDGETGPSPALSAVLAAHRVQAPVYFDADQTSSKAFNNWGTPQYYVLDEGGRLRFDGVATARAALVRAEAVRLSENVMGARGAK